MKIPTLPFTKWLIPVASLALFSLMTTVQAATFYAKNAPELRNRIQQAKNNGAASKDLIKFTGNGTFIDGGQIVINTPCVIQGLDRKKSKIKNGDNKGDIFLIVSSNVTIRNLSLLANNGEGTRGIKLGAVANIVIQANTFYENQVGIVSFGPVPVNVKVLSSNFLQNKTAMWTFRDSGKSGCIGSA